MPMNTTNIALPSEGIDPRIIQAYTPGYEAGVENILKQKGEAREDIFTQLAKRGTLSSSILPNALLRLSEVTQSAIGGLTGQMTSEMAQTQIALSEAKRQEGVATSTGLLSTALSFISPVLGQFIGTAIAGGGKNQTAIQDILATLKMMQGGTDIYSGGGTDIYSGGVGAVPGLDLGINRLDVNSILGSI